LIRGRSGGGGSGGGSWIDHFSLREYALHYCILNDTAGGNSFPRLKLHGDFNATAVRVKALQPATVNKSLFFYQSKSIRYFFVAYAD